jgi:hypothetical protein
MRALFIAAIITLTLSLSGCGRHEIIDRAKADFASRHPEWIISKAYVGEGDSDHVYVHVQYIHTPAAAYPRRPVIMEMVLGYQRMTNGWLLFHEQGSKYIGLAPRR